jgi:hypothetical protein
MRKLLLTVERVFVVTGRGVIVTPEIPIDQLPEIPSSSAILKRPDGTTINAKASFHIPHIHTQDIEVTLKQLNNPRYVCIVEGIDKSEIPVGTELWVESHISLS